MEVVFDFQRFGFREIGLNILNGLDYFSFVAFKRTCKTVADFIDKTRIEAPKLKAKLDADWRRNEAELKAEFFVTDKRKRNSVQSVKRLQFVDLDDQT